MPFCQAAAVILRRISLKDSSRNDRRN
jgi:hypothetical protein